MSRRISTFAQALAICRSLGVEVVVSDVAASGSHEQSANILELAKAAHQSRVWNQAHHLRQTRRQRTHPNEPFYRQLQRRHW